MPSSSPVVRAIDVGFGLVKLSLRTTTASGSRASHRWRSRPMQARCARWERAGATPSTSGQRRELRGGPRRRPGSGGRQLRPRRDRRVLSRCHLRSADERRAALHGSKPATPVIDVLVLGLPSISTTTASGATTFARTTRATSGRRRQDDQVRKVMVQAQPMGGYAALDDHLDELNASSRRRRGASSRWPAARPWTISPC